MDSIERITIPEISEEKASTYLKAWLQARHTRMPMVQSWSRCAFSDRPYWAAVVDLFSLLFIGRKGFHVYDDGEVVFVGPMDNDIGTY